MDVMFIVELLGSVFKVHSAVAFLFTWGWGDATWGDPIIHPGHPDDQWHKQRRKYFYQLVIAAFLPGYWILNLVLLALLGIFGRKIFRGGVKHADPETYRRWYG